jgi:hypothetical protein
MNEIKRLQQLAGLLNEDVSDFHIGQSSETGGRKTTVTDIDPETQSITWSVKKEVDNSTIHKDLSDLITKFEKVQLKDFHSRPKLIQLVKDLKSIRNKFSRTVVKEDLRILKENLVGILKEIKINDPSRPIVYIEQDQPYIPLKDGSRMYGYWGDDKNNFSIEDTGDDFDEAIKYFGNSAELIDDGRTHYLLVYNKDVNIK